MEKNKNLKHLYFPEYNGNDLYHRIVLFEKVEYFEVNEYDIFLSVYINDVKICYSDNCAKIMNGKIIFSKGNPTYFEIGDDGLVYDVYPNILKCDSMVFSALNKRTRFLKDKKTVQEL